MNRRILSLFMVIVFVFCVFSSAATIEKPSTVKPVGEIMVAAPDDDTESGGDTGDDDSGDDTSGGDDPEPPAPDVAISFNNPPSTLTVGTKQQINVTLTNAPTNTTIRWESSNRAVASVDSDGNVTAVSPGKVEITASVPNSDAKTSTLIEIEAAKAKSIKITSKEFSAADLLLSQHPLAIGDILHLSYEIDPKDAEKEDIKWSSDNEAVAAVSADGVVTAAAAGNATITVTMGDLTDSISFKVDKEKSSMNFLLLISAGLLLIAIIIIVVLLVKRSKRKKAEREAQERKVEQLKREAMQRDNSIRQNAESIEAMQNRGEYTDDRTKVFTTDEIDPFAEDRADAEDASAGETPSALADIDDIIGVDEETDYLEKESDEQAPPQEPEKEEPFSLDDIE